MNDEDSASVREYMTSTEIRRQQAAADDCARAEELRTPSNQYRPTLSIDGNQWCALYGANPQEGVAGFGKSPYLAYLDFDKQWYEELSS